MNPDEALPPRARGFFPSLTGRLVPASIRCVLRRWPPALRLLTLVQALLCCVQAPAEPSLRAANSPPAAKESFPTSLARLHAGHTALAEAHEDHLSFVLQPIPGGHSVLVVSQRADERVAFARRIGEHGDVGPLQRFVDAHILGALERGSASQDTAIITSEGGRLCVTSPGWSRSACVKGAPAATVSMGDRVAILELAEKHPSEPAVRAPLAPARASTPAKPARSGASGSHVKTSKPKKTLHGVPARRPSRPWVDLMVRWIDARGVLDDEAKPTGLRFEAPMDGMTLADARARPSNIDVLWYEVAPGPRGRTPLGRGRLVAGSLRQDGSFDLASRGVVLEAEVEIGQLRGHRAPRLVGNDQGSVYLGVDDKGHGEAMGTRPAGTPLAVPSVVGQIAPDRLAGPIAPAELAVFERMLAEEPRRAFGQPKTDLGLTAWAGDRAYFLRGSKLRFASKADGTGRDEPAPFVAHRARIAWGALAPDGEGVAFVNGSMVHVDRREGLARAPASREVKLGTLGAPETLADRRRAVRIGTTWWLARGERLRVWPDIGPAVDAIPCPPDTAVLVGGREHGMSLRLEGAALRVARVCPAGLATELATIPFSVGPGFDACEREAGGALVAGVNPADPSQVLAFALDAQGHAGAVQRVPLPLRPGELAVRILPLPTGGALITDLERRHVVWVDADARVLGADVFPPDESDVVCVDGRPMRRVVPGPFPHQFIPVPEVATGACMVGDPVFTPEGALRWLGATVVGLDASAELASLAIPSAVASSDVASATEMTPGPAPAAVPSPSMSAAPPFSRCPADMVPVASRVCVDRFESALLDDRTGAFLSPDYPVTPHLLEVALGEWSTGRERVGNLHARAFPLPWIAPERVGDKPEPVAVSRLGVRPNGYVTGLVAASACVAAGKRLCTLDEFVTACRGEADTLFPYGKAYQEGICNVFRDEHPAVVLHNNASVGHLDPRLNRVESHGRPLFQRTGQSPGCRSRWGNDAIYDMVGNLDEWVDQSPGAFAGGFYARSTRSGCEALVTAHPRPYLDYSTGVRCCRDPLVEP